MNPFDTFGIDPNLGPAAITAHFRARMEAARSDAERDALRDAWDALVRHPRERVLHALRAVPPREPLAGKPPPKKRVVRGSSELQAHDFVVLPGLGDDLVLGAADRAEILSDDLANDPLLHE